MRRSVSPVVRLRRSVSPVVRRELENLDKDVDSRKIAMEVLKSYVKELNVNEIPLFVAQVSEMKESEFTGEYTISLYEVLARAHGTKIVSQIDIIMSTIMKTLASSEGSFGLHQACSKVVSAIARYGMDPTTTEDKKRYIVYSLSKPLSDCLLGSLEGLSSGAAMCLKALVECDNWRFASSEMVNEVCQRVVGSLEKHTQTNSHMALVMALAKHDSLIVEAYARLLIHTAVNILNTGVMERNSQKRLYAIHMINTIMKCLDPKSISSEVWLIVDEMEKFQADETAYVSGAAAEALQTARRICSEKSSIGDRDTDSVFGSSCSRRENKEGRGIRGSGQRSPLTACPELQTINSFCRHDYFMDSPVSINSTSHSFQGLGYDCKGANCKIWSRHVNRDVDNVSLEDGILSEGIHTSGSNENESNEFLSGHEDRTHDFEGFSQGSDAIACLRNATSSPQKSWNVDNVKIFTTPQKLMQPLQEPNDSISESSEKRTGRHESPSSRKLEQIPTLEQEKTCHCNGLSSKEYDDGRSSTDDEQFRSSTESECSTTDLPTCTNPQILSETKSAHLTKPRIIQAGRWITRRFVLGILMILFVVLAYLFCINDQEVGFSMVPT